MMGTSIEKYMKEAALLFLVGAQKEYAQIGAPFQKLQEKMERSTYITKTFIEEYRLLNNPERSTKYSLRGAEERGHLACI